jgi:hypothetical protein
METNSKNLMKVLPDFSDMQYIIDEMKSLNVRKMSLDKKIKEEESKAFSRVMGEEKFQVNGKPPAVNFYDNAYKYRGIEDSILPLRQEYLEVVAELDALKLKYDLYKEMLDMFKTLVYQERGMI